MSDNTIQYYVNQEKGTVVCVLTGCHQIARIRLNKAEYPVGELMILPDDDVININNQFIGKAVLAPGDTWNEDFGKKLAYQKAREKRAAAINHAIDKQIEQLQQVIQNLQDLKS